MAFFGAKQITRTTVFWSEPALQLCKLGWIQFQILHNNLLSWSLAFRTELSPCVYLCVNADTSLMTTNCNKHGAPPVTALPELIKKTFQSIMLRERDAARVFRSACARHKKKDSYHSSWGTSCSASARPADKFKTQLEETEEDDERHLRENSTRCSCGGGLCERWCARGNTKGGEKETHGCVSEAAFSEKIKTQKDRKREIQIRAALFQAISGPAAGFMAHLCDWTSSFLFLQSCSHDWRNTPERLTAFQGTDTWSCCNINKWRRWELEEDLFGLSFPPAHSHAAASKKCVLLFIFSFVQKVTHADTPLKALQKAEISGYVWWISVYS